MPAGMAERLRHCTGWVGEKGVMGLVSPEDATEIWGAAWALTHRVILAAIEAGAFDWDEFAVTRWKKAEFVRARAVLTPILRCFISPRPRYGGPLAPISFPAIAALSGRRNHTTVITQYRKWERRGENRAAAMVVARRLQIDGLELALHRMAVGKK